MSPKLCLAQDPEADELLSNSPLALLFGMLLDQQIPMEKAFKGPKVIADRMGELSVHRIAEASEEEFAAVMSEVPAVHRFPGSMGKRLQTLAQYLIEHYDGDPKVIWTRDEPDGKTVLKRLKALPGYGDQKARIFLALLGKQLGIQPDGWREAAGDYGDEGARRSVADVRDRATLSEVREFKKAAKAAAK
ncbi:HhH-GPD-type base excision DNA repair protein [Actinosynnema sp. NPDC047251]|uniref:HhH-GPD base excision DNA repair family protein n=1 Tax=Saccharothrix espanaensis (strain ATCC 51144 / DSM 44229 / JCM 9112 / NBRC 15066 / NRRL 15764) TaxID=1179773 RepID=K0KBS7_SACES|nr:HhH-GPD-type base excision DNA repair protein [Saccharothrix espanaensis]CCH35002.1 HhH-GPD base excision DNA repair family protein [Saccharothrix espanaensis DSM 44229]